MSDAVSGYGTLLKMGDGAVPEVFTTIAEVKDIGGPSMSAETIDVTHQTSPGAVREFIASLLDAGEVSFGVNWIPSHPTQDETSGLISAYLTRAKKNFKLVWPTVPSVECTFKALVTGIEPTAPVEDAATADITLKVSGLPTFADVV